MQLSGNKPIPASVDKAYGLMTDPEILTRTMPGLKQLTPISQGEYAADLEVGVAAIKGKYHGTMRIQDADPPQFYRLVLEGQGTGGFVSVNMAVNFTSSDDGTMVNYEGQAEVGGTIASVGQRMISGVANYLMNQFFQALAKEALHSSP